jgi:periplasmic divalent cation tolerance protein
MTKQTTQTRVVLCTCPDSQSAERLANGLVAQRLAACVNRIGPIQSTYEWQGKVCCDEEFQLLIKTTPERVAALRDWLVNAHPYEVPEIITLLASDVLPAYQNWIHEVLALPALEEHSPC